MHTLSDDYHRAERRIICGGPETKTEGETPVEASASGCRLSDHQAVVGPSSHRAVAGLSGHQGMVGQNGHRAGAGQSGHPALVGPSGNRAVAGPSSHQAIAGSSGRKARNRSQAIQNVVCKYLQFSACRFSYKI